jgi:hypothetical protein
MNELTGPEIMKIEAYLACLDSENLGEFEALMDHLARGREDPSIEGIRALIARENLRRKPDRPLSDQIPW